MTCMQDLMRGPMSFGAGPTAKELDRQNGEIVQRALASPGAGSSAWSRILAVLDAAESASEFNWDGYGAKPVHPDAASYAMRFLASLATDFPSPEVAVDPDGEVSLEWYASADNVFSVSVSPRGDLHFAGRFGKSTLRGREALHSHAFAGILQSCVSRVLAAKGNGVATVR